MAFRLIVACTLLATVYGASIPSISERIVGGDEVSIEEFPWQCSVQSDDEHIGSAVILTRRHAVTVASLVSDQELQETLLLRCGSTHRTSGGTVKAIDRVIVHENFDTPVAFNNDIAILVFKYLVQIGSSIAPIHVAGLQFALPPNSTVILSGWASPEEGQDPSEIPTALQAIELNSVDQAQCVAAHGNVDEGEAEGQPRVTESQICAIDAEINGNSACSGDIGNPLVFIHNSTAVLLGLTSWSAGCGENTPPAVFTRLASHIEWLRANL